MNLFSFDRQGSDIKPLAAGAPIEAQVAGSGARVGVELSATPSGHQAHLLASRMLPQSVRGFGLVDTGTTRTLISDAIADVLSLEFLYAVELHTALSATMALCYGVEIQLFDVTGARTQPVEIVVARIAELREDVVLGLDVLRQFRFEWDGPADSLRIWPAGSVARP